MESLPVVLHSDVNTGCINGSVTQLFSAKAPFNIWRDVLTAIDLNDLRLPDATAAHIRSPT